MILSPAAIRTLSAQWIPASAGMTTQCLCAPAYTISTWMPFASDLNLSASALVPTIAL